MLKQLKGQLCFKIVKKHHIIKFIVFKNQHPSKGFDQKSPTKYTFGSKNTNKLHVLVMLVTGGWWVIFEKKRIIRWCFLYKKVT